MGVFAEAVLKAKKELSCEGGKTFQFTIDGLERSAYLPDNVLPYVQVQLPLTKMNDDGKSFEEIADYIEKNLQTQEEKEECKPLQK